MRAATKAILYLLRTGCPWRFLPRGSFPPRSTVYNIFRKFQRDGVAKGSARRILLTTSPAPSRS
jgi:transposase